MDTQSLIDRLVAAGREAVSEFNAMRDAIPNTREEDRIRHEFETAMFNLEATLNLIGENS